MIRTQLNLFKIKSEKKLIKNIDYIDVSKIKAVDSHIMNKLFNYDILEENKYILYKTGGNNIWRPDLGPVFPYIKNTATNKIVKFFVNKTYVRMNLRNNKINKVINVNVHRLIAEAFIENKDPERLNVVNHENKDRLDYRVDNLEWVTQSQNLSGRKVNRKENLEVTMIKKGIV
jgi:hypothetical protein